MKRFLNWQVALGVLLVALSVFVYYIHYLIFRDLHHIFLYLIGDIAFLFIEVLIVTLILHKLLAAREKRSMMKKMNMVIGAFFSEVGTELMRKLCAFDGSAQVMGRHMLVTKGWTKKQFVTMSRAAMEHKCSIDCKKADMPALKEFLAAKRGFLLTLLENPNLLEHESFTNLLWAVFHLTEELSARRDFGTLPRSDYDHLAGDIGRAEGLLISEWLAYVAHLKADYPYLFSLAVRMNPFDPNASAVVL
jgi:hypothetical protein